VIEPESDRIDSAPAAEGTKKVWQAPTLTLLGDVRKLTETGGSSRIDSNGTST
jgi:hypothetical protein